MSKLKSGIRAVSHIPVGVAVYGGLLLLEVALWLVDKDGDYRG